METKTLLDQVTQMVIDMLHQEEGKQPVQTQTDACTSCAPSVGLLGTVPGDLVSDCYTVKTGATAETLSDCQYIVMETQQLSQLRPSSLSTTAQEPGNRFDMMGKCLIHKRDLEKFDLKANDVVHIGQKASITPLAQAHMKAVGAHFEVE